MLRQEDRPLDGLRFKVKEGRDYRKRIYLRWQGRAQIVMAHHIKAAHTDHLVLLLLGSRPEKYHLTAKRRVKCLLRFCKFQSCHVVTNYSFFLGFLDL